jgi:enoyl-CoA hydratase
MRRRLVTAESYEYLIYETPANKVARIVLNRPPVNAQNTKFLYELNAAFDRAAHDDDITVIILAANGKHFSAGHDLSETDTYKNMSNFETVGTMVPIRRRPQLATDQRNRSGFCL